MTGGGYYEAARVGLDSFANKLTAKAKVFKRELTPLQKQVVQIVRVLLIVVIVFEILVWVRNVAGGVPFVESVRMSTVILALIPNGLVLSIALTYALGAVRLLGKDVLVQQFNAVESLSNVDVLCTDKTGTLTSGVVTYEELAGLGADDARAARLLGAFAASTTDANRTIEALRTALPAERLTAAHQAFFSSERKWSGLAFADGEARGTYALGAPEVLASAFADGDAAWRAQADAWAARGLRVVLFAGCDEPAAFADEPDETPDSCGPAPVALVCFSDELRPGVAARWRSSRRPASRSRSSAAITPRRWRRWPAKPAWARQSSMVSGPRPYRPQRRRHRADCRRQQRVRPRLAAAEGAPGRRAARPRPLRGDHRRRRQRRHLAQERQRGHRHAGRQPGRTRRRRHDPAEGLVRARCPGRSAKGSASSTA